MDSLVESRRTVAGLEPALPITARPRLVAICVGGAVGASALAGILGERSAVAITAQVTAPPPFGVLHDLRWLLVFHNSWGAFVAGFAAMVVFRTALTTAVLIAAWPADVARPPIDAILRRAVAFTILLAVVLLPWAGVLYAEAVAPVSWLFFTGLPSALLVAIVIHHALGRPGWWRRTGPIRSVGWLLFAFVVLSAAAAVIAVTPFPLSLIPAAATGLFNAWAWNGVASAVVRPPRHALLLPAPAVLILVALGVVAGTVLGFDTHSVSTAIIRTPSSARVDSPVLVVSGFGSRFDGADTARFGRDDLERRFSYRGLDARGRPLPYVARDTTRSLSALERSMGDQVDALARAARKPVAIVAESEGSLVAEEYVATVRPHNVSRVVMESPLIDPGRVWYPPRGAQGWGVATAWLLRGIDAAVGGLSSHQFPPDAPLFRSIVDEGPRLRRVRSCFPPGIAQTVLFPLADAVAAPFSTTADVSVHVVPAFHGGLLTNEAARRTVLLALRGRVIAPHPLLNQANLAIRAAASAWHVPTLPDALNPRWRALDGRGC